MSCKVLTHFISGISCLSNSHLSMHFTISYFVLCSLGSLTAFLQGLIIIDRVTTPHLLWDCSLRTWTTKCRIHCLAVKIYGYWTPSFNYKVSTKKVFVYVCETGMLLSHSLISSGAAWIRKPLQTPQRRPEVPGISRKKGMKLFNLFYLWY